MSFAHWLEETVDRFNKYPLRKALRGSAVAFHAGLKKRYYSLRERQVAHQRGTRIYERGDWDILIVMDAMRPDALAEVAGNYDWLPEPGTYPEVHAGAGYSRDWLRIQFGDEYADQRAETAMVNWNAYCDFELDPDDFCLLDEVWRDGWDNDQGLVPPETMVDRAIRAYRSTESEFFVVHMMQPHAPYRSVDDVELLDETQVGNIDNGRETIWDLVRTGEYSHEEAWAAYLDNLEWALGELPRLLAEFDDENVVVTADHGELFGEYGLYGHPRRTMMPEQVMVPWAPVDLGAVPDDVEAGFVGSSDDPVQDNAKQRLKELGYV